MRSMILSFIALQSDPFAHIRASLADFLLVLLGLVAMVSLAITVIHIIQGDRDGAKKAGVWLMATVVGFALISIIGYL